MSIWRAFFFDTLTWRRRLHKHGKKKARPKFYTNVAAVFACAMRFCSGLRDQHAYQYRRGPFNKMRSLKSWQSIRLEFVQVDSNRNGFYWIRERASYNFLVIVRSNFIV